MSYGAGAASLSTSDMKRPQTLSGCVDALTALADRAQNILEDQNTYANRLGGNTEPPSAKLGNGAVEPVPSGQVEAIARQIERLDYAMNGIVNHQGRLERALG